MPSVQLQLQPGINLFDIRTTSGRYYSPHVWKVRLAINFKGLQHTVHRSYVSELAEVCQNLGIPHTSLYPDGKPHYTAPAIIDKPSTGEKPVIISDSQPILEYLDKTYPSPAPYPSLCTPQAMEFIQSFNEVFNRIQPIMNRLMVRQIYNGKPPADQAIFTAKVKAIFGMSVEELELKGEEREAAFRKLRELLQFETLPRPDGLEAGSDILANGFLMGSVISLVDFIFAGWLTAYRELDRETLWNPVAKWDDGRLEKYLGQFSAWTSTASTDQGNEAHL